MTKFKKLVAISTAIVIMGTTGSAFAADLKNPKDLLSELTGKTTQQIQQAMQTGKTPGDIAKEAGKLAEFNAQILVREKARLDQEVKDGKLTQAKADEMYKEIKTNVESGKMPMMRMGKGDRGGYQGIMGKGLGVANSVDTLATVTGKTVADIQKELSAGKTIVTIATEAGKLDAFNAKILELHKAELNQEVKDGKLTQAKADEMYKEFQANIASGKIGIGEGKGRQGQHEGRMGERQNNNGINPVDTLATVTGKTVADIQKELSAGKTINTIATEAGKLDAFHAKMLVLHKAALDKDVKDGKLTQAKADEMYKEFQTRQANGNVEKDGQGHKMGEKGQGQGQGKGMGRGIGQNR